MGRGRGKSNLKESCSNIYLLSLFFSLALVAAIVAAAAPALLLLNLAPPENYKIIKPPAVKSLFYYQEVEERKLLGFSGMSRRRFLSGPGSWPPRCWSKCGQCTPCKPVHVPVPPGTPVTAEYYPEAWRCKCGNKYYMP
ncbi:EPIDERMAL PATTERNING FACTOR-like protein 6 [Impatiens glandulifera]|uniref:EPIDERMAL PATTERNING FACTOR-like protein 6 n=1 Tax=Impatiens glandulifera TaxID=253017 RepID=UPI001FB0C029|nr:EPIDERMAL PATTERNING FACTOR-like protein 6 [Impatiens glandulifera]